MGVIQAVDQVQVTRAAASGADGEASGELRLGSGGECGRLLVTHVHPLERAALPNLIGNRIEAVPDDAVDPLHTGIDERANELTSDRPIGHEVLLPSGVSA